MTRRKLQTKHILEHIIEFYENLFKKRQQKSVVEMENFSVMSIFQNSENLAKLCEKDLGKKTHTIL